MNFRRNKSGFLNWKVCLFRARKNPFVQQCLGFIFSSRGSRRFVNPTRSTLFMRIRIVIPISIHRLRLELPGEKELWKFVNAKTLSFFILIVDCLTHSNRRFLVFVSEHSNPSHHNHGNFRVRLQTEYR